MKLDKTKLKRIFVLLLIVLISSSFIPKVSGVTLELFTDNIVYTDGKPLFVYGNALPNENLIVRLFAPDGTIAKFDQITVDREGMYNHVLLVWPDSSTTFPYGTYTVEVISSTQNGICHAPKNKIVMSAPSVTISMNSAMKNMPNLIPLYSVK